MAVIDVCVWNSVFGVLYCSGSDDEYSDDDDISWKVRRASAKCLAAIMATRHEMLRDFYAVISPTLISRFKGKTDFRFVFLFIVVIFSQSCSSRHNVMRFCCAKFVCRAARVLHLYLFTVITFVFLLKNTCYCRQIR